MSLKMGAKASAWVKITVTGDRMSNCRFGNIEHPALLKNTFFGAGAALGWH
jgi:hypothetical protein